MTPWLEAREFGYILFGTLFATLILIWVGYKCYEYIYERAYWSGRNDGWRASVQHQERVRRMKLDEVFDYEKN